MIRIGVICPSEIALRRFMPALMKCNNFKYVGISVCSKEELFVGTEHISDERKQQIIESDYRKANDFVGNYGGKIFESYMELVTSDDIDAVYIPLPPALHYKWAKVALEHKKHVLIEKPSTISLNDTKELVDLAKKNNVALHENYMFVFHKQLEKINDIVKSGKIGHVRMYRICFGFPQRAVNDFRYNKELGGGALIDAGGYTLKLARLLLGDKCKILCATMNYTEDFDVDIFGSGTVINENGFVAQLSYGMANQYKCELEIWGSTGALFTDRILTAPVGFKPELTIQNGSETMKVALPEDDTFKKSILRFEDSINDETIRQSCRDDIVKQAEMVEDFRALAGNN